MGVAIERGLTVQLCRGPYIGVRYFGGRYLTRHWYESLIHNAKYQHLERMFENMDTGRWESGEVCRVMRF